MVVTFTAFFDACILYPAPLRDLLLQLGTERLFRAKWSNRVHDEWISNLLEKRPDLTREKLERTRTLMNENTLDCLVEGYDHLIETLDLPDPNDRHVLAAAIHSRSDVIVTFNLKDFPRKTLQTYKIEIRHPDAFIADLLDLNENAVVHAVRTLRARLKSPPKTIDEYLECIERQGLPETSSRLREIRAFL